ncbi:MAG: ComF family protein [Erysipelotrichaceae bacterium]|nr:ComF family protein [Erysipelotrichaceae bacterium]
MRHCLYCLKEIGKEELNTVFLRDDPLCPACRKALQGHFRRGRLGSLRYTCLYSYGPDSLFREMLLQYKEAYDEALAPVFLAPYAETLKLRYRSFTLVCLPSAPSHEAERGFCHLEEITRCLDLPRKRITMKEDLSQKGKTKEERKQMEGNFCFLDEIRENEKILLFDDVLSSGATMRGAYRLLRQKTASIRIFVLSEAQREASFCTERRFLFPASKVLLNKIERC